VSGSGISWAVRKSAPRCRQITTPAPHHTVFYRPDALPVAQPTASQSSEGRAYVRYCAANVSVGRGPLLLLLLLLLQDAADDCKVTPGQLSRAPDLPRTEGLPPFIFHFSLMTAAVWRKSSKESGLWISTVVSDVVYDLKVLHAWSLYW